MPIYEYQCQKCQHEFEVIQKMSEDPLKQCPQCGKETLEKLISRSSFQLKGTGWYQTDFKNPPKAKEEKKPDVKEVKAETKTDTKTTETK